MINILLDHSNLKSSRRALLVSSIITLFLPKITLTGSGLQFFGLVLNVDSDALFALSWYLTIYFFVIFSCFAIGQFIDAFAVNFSERIKERIKLAREQAVQIDEEMQVRGEPEYFYEPEPWWAEAGEISRRMTNRESWVVFVSKAVIQSLTVLVDVALVFAVGFTATFYPLQVSELLFGQPG